MYLTTDEQTINDLRIFGKRDAGGIYDIYNNTHTRGAEKVLEQMFRNPLSNKEEINRRCSIIENFSLQGTVFPYETALFDMAEKYLLAAVEQEKSADKQSLLSEKEIMNGVTAVIALMQLTRDFVKGEAVRKNLSFSKESASIIELLNDPAFEPVLREQGKGKISYGAATAYDQLFRTRERNKIEKLLEYIYYLDVYISVAAVARERNFVFPKALDRELNRLSLEGVYHPELNNPVGNDIAMDAAQNLIYLTGANMAGKSTFLRSLSTAVYIAHVGFPVAAASMEFSVIDGIYTTINLPDNLGIGASHFYAEVLRVKKVAAELHSGKSLFIVFDELFRGTNVKDAYEATVEVILAFAKRKQSRFIISSHIVEAGERLQQLPGIGFQYLPTRMNGHVPEYTYRLENGITADRHGMIIIQNEGILDILRDGRKRSKQRINLPEKTAGA
jgi:DNA mismatch repair protein MutS